MPSGLYDVVNFDSASTSNQQRGKGVTLLTLPGTLTSVGEYAFKGCSGLTSLTLPKTLTSVGRGVFRDCSGVTSAFGERVRRLGPALGATCFGFAFGSLASSARTDAGLLVRKPPHLSHEEACSLPITFSTVRNSPTLSHAYAPRLQCTHAQRGTLDPTMRLSCC